MRVKLLEPFPPDDARQVDVHGELIAASVLACADRQVELGIADDRAGRQPDPAAADHHSGPLSTAPLDQAIGIGQQEGFEDRLVLLSLMGLGRLTATNAPPAQTDQLIAEPGHLTCGGRIDAPGPQGRGKTGRARLDQRVEPHEDVGRSAARPLGFSLLARRNRTRASGFPSPRATRRPRPRAQPAAVGGLQDQPRQPGMDREVEHPATQLGDPCGITFDGPQQVQETFGCGEPIGRWGVEPTEPHRIVDAPGMQGQHGPAEIDPVDLRLLEGGQSPFLASRPEADATARARTSRASRALIGRGAADPAQVPSVDSPAGIESHGSDQAAVDDRIHAVDRERGLRNISAQDDLTLRTRP